MFDDRDQVIRSWGSVGANDREANEALSKKDFANSIKICRKEGKESAYWLRMLARFIPDDLMPDCRHMAQEAFELQKIFGSIIRKLDN